MDAVLRPRHFLLRVVEDTILDQRLSPRDFLLPASVGAARARDVARAFLGASSSFLRLSGRVAALLACRAWR